MDPRLNPYTPNAGVRPPALVGRDAELDQAFEFMLERLRRGHADQAMLVTGLRGVGKTVLLGAFAERAAHRRLGARSRPRSRPTHRSGRGWRSSCDGRCWSWRHATDGATALRRAAGVLQSFSITVSSDGVGDRHDRRRPDRGHGRQRGARGGSHRRAASRSGRRRASRRPAWSSSSTRSSSCREEFEALIRALHKHGQRQLPVTLLGAGLRISPGWRGRRSPTPSGSSGSDRLGPLAVPDAIDGADRARQRPRGDVRRTSRRCRRRVHGGLPLLHPGVRQGVVGPGGGIAHHRDRGGRGAGDRRGEVGRELLPGEGPASERTGDSRTCGRWRSWVPNRSGPATSRAVPADRPESLGKLADALDRQGTAVQPAYGYAAFTVPQFDRFLRRCPPRLALSR